MRKLVLKGSSPPKEYALNAESFIGSQAGLAIQIARAEPRHARVLKNGENVFIEDLNSKLGLTVNGKKLTRTALKKGDLIDIAGTVFVFDDDGKPDAAQAAKTNSAIQPKSNTVVMNKPPSTPGVPVAKGNTVAIPKNPPSAVVKPPNTPGVPAARGNTVVLAKGATKPPSTPGTPAAKGNTVVLNKPPSGVHDPGRKATGMQVPVASRTPSPGASARLATQGSTVISVRTKNSGAIITAANTTAHAKGYGPRFGTMVALGVLVAVIVGIVYGVRSMKKEPDVAGPSEQEKAAFVRLHADGPKDPADLVVARKLLLEIKTWRQAEAALGVPPLKVTGRIPLWSPNEGTRAMEGNEFRAYYVKDQLAQKNDSQVVSILLFRVDSEDAVICLGNRIYALKETPPLHKVMEMQKEAAEREREAAEEQLNNGQAPKAPVPSNEKF